MGWKSRVISVEVKATSLSFSFPGFHESGKRSLKTCAADKIRLKYWRFRRFVCVPRPPCKNSQAGSRVSSTSFTWQMDLSYFDLRQCGTNKSKNMAKHFYDCRRRIDSQHRAKVFARREKSDGTGRAATHSPFPFYLLTFWPSAGTEYINQ